jgi:hypothetical protein
MSEPAAESTIPGINTALGNNRPVGALLGLRSDLYDTGTHIDTHVIVKDTPW